ncbi:hypothetical protein GCM10010245_34270 [Streptomyces spectabilis]|nr:hypothetical protein GCM10010245_34270 [Streptomyces spectabilis]
MLRGLVAAAAASAVLGSVVMRRWDRAAGKRVAELGRARASEEWRYEERIAECESDLDEARELRSKLENKLRSKRAELAALRNEHAALLRRYATAETERASALEGRRLLALGATGPATRALPPASSEDSAAAETPEASLYERANAALDRLAERDAEPEPEPEDDHERAVGAQLMVPAAAVVVPAAAQVRRSAGEGGFDFFGTKATDVDAKSAAPAALDAVQNEDLADVVGEEALAVHKAQAEAEFKPSDAATDAERGVGQVIDLTAHDETEQIDLKGLRTALRA